MVLECCSFWSAYSIILTRSILAAKRVCNYGAIEIQIAILKKFAFLELVTCVMDGWGLCTAYWASQ